MADTSDERMRQQVREYWDANPRGTQFAETQWGTKEFFEEVEQFRYTLQPFMRSAIRSEGGFCLWLFDHQEPYELFSLAPFCNPGFKRKCPISPST